jgi:hypothetical protein
MELAPIEYMKWPKGVPLPSFDEIRDTALSCANMEDTEVSRNRNYGSVLVRQVIYALCTRLRGMSTVEVSAALGGMSHSQFTGKANNFGRKYMASHVGVAAANEVTYCLLRNKLNNVAAERREQNQPAPFDAASITRAALTGHAGGAA